MGSGRSSIIILFTFCLCLALLAVPRNSYAIPEIYTYSGNPFDSFLDDDPKPADSYDNTMRITGSFTLPAPLASGLTAEDIAAQVIAFSFSTGERP